MNNSEKAKRRAKRKRIKLLIQSLMVILPVCLILLAMKTFYQKSSSAHIQTMHDVTSEKYIEDWPDFDVELLEYNAFSRPGELLPTVNGIVIHYTANPGSTAKQNRDYFNGLAQSQETYASAHFIVGLEGEIIQCIPCNEIAYASNERNADTLAIECCIPDQTGRFNEETYHSVVELTAWLVGRYDLNIDQVIRHYDVTGKNCPKYYVENEKAWDNLKNDILLYIDENGTEKSN